MQRTSLMTSILIITLTSIAAIAQMAPPTPAPELKKLDYLAGTWSMEATIPSGPWGAGGKFAATNTSEWMKGNFFLVGHSDFSSPAELGGTGTAISVISYDADKKAYIQETFDSNGHREVAVGTLNGDTWTWTSENNYGGMTIQSRATNKMVSPTSFTMKYEVSADGGATWMTFWDGKGTKK
jgi:Protein of unknown function (DUF1579)